MPITVPPRSPLGEPDDVTLSVRTRPAKRRHRRTFGHVRRLPSKRYQASYLGPDGQRHVAPTTFQTKGDADAWVSLQSAAIIEGRWRPAREAAQPLPRFEEYARTWLHQRDLKPRTSREYSRLLQHLLPTFGPARLDSITREGVRSWYTAMGSTRPSARAHSYALMRSILNTAVDEELLSANPCRIRGAGQAPSRTGIRPATLEELQQIASAMPERYRLMVQMAAWCALRFGELTELRRKDVDLRQQVIRVRRAVTWPGGKAYVSTPKSAAGIRDVSIPPHLLPLIRDHLELHSQRGADGLVFPNTDGRHMHHGSLYKVYRPARAAAGRSDLRWHDLRHTGATMAAVAGATTRELMDRLGHSTTTMAMRYQHVADNRPAEIARRLSLLATDDLRYDSPELRPSGSLD